jgi:methyl-accepting chemotaxis protein
MGKEDTASINAATENLEHLISDLTIALNRHAQYLEKHTAGMESLAQTVKQLDITINKKRALEFSGPSRQLCQAVTAIVEYYINPQFYASESHLKLTAAKMNAKMKQLKQQN